MGLLDGKVAIVTGAGRGIGRGEALLLASEGAAVVVNDLGGEWDGEGADQRPAQQVVDEIVAAGGRASANYASVADFDAAGALVRQAIDEFGRLDILVNNAGILRDKMIFNLGPEDFDAVVAVHLRGHFCTMRHACAYWREQSKAGETVAGRIINTSSASGVFANAGQANYAAAKAGIAAMTQVVSLEMARYGVTANALCPTARTRLTQMGTSVMGEAPEDGAWSPLDPDNVAPLVAFLASDAAADVTGHVFGVFGGTVQVYEGWRPGPKISRPQPGPLTPAEIVDRKGELFAEVAPTFVSRMAEVSSDVFASMQPAS